jgi:hypothetical protein
MATSTKKVTKRVVTKKDSETTKLSKAGKAMRAGVLKGSVIEISKDPWNLSK